MKIYTKTFILLAVTAWLLPAFANSTLHGVPKEQPLPAPRIETAGPVLNVITQPSSASIFVADLKNPAAAACALSTPAASTLLQDQAGFNLNQPASCFSLTPGSLVVQRELAVAHFQTSSEIKVLNSPSATIFAYQMAPYTSGTSFPVLPLPGFALPVMAAAAMLILTKDRTRKIISQRKDVLSLIQLQVMRC